MLEIYSDKKKVLEDEGVVCGAWRKRERYRSDNRGSLKRYTFSLMFSINF